MKKLAMIGLACGLLLTACNGLNVKNDDETNTLEETRANDNNTLMQTKSDAAKPIKPQRFLDRNLSILFDGKRMSIEELARVLDDKLERENSGLDFYVNIDAEDDNTQ